MVALTLILQLVGVWVNMRNGPRRESVKEMLIVVSCVKPGVNAYRVANGTQKPAGHALFSLDIELTCTKIFEIVCESIPGSVLQSSALLKASKEGYSNQAIFSIIVSALTTGYSTATIR